MTEPRTIYDNGFLRVTATSINGRDQVCFDRVKTQTGCIVVPITPAGKVVLTREYRHGAGGEVIGVVKGAQDHEAESVEDIARRELLEELGMTVTDVEVTALEPYALPAYTATRGRIAFAYGCHVIAHQELEPNEQVSIYGEVDEVELLALLRNGTITDGESCVALQQFLIQRLLPQVAVG